MELHRIAALVLLVAACVFFAAWIRHNHRVYKEVDQWNNATTPEEIQALLPPGHRYDPETRLCHPPEPGALPYHRGMLRAE